MKKTGKEKLTAGRSSFASENTSIICRGTEIKLWNSALSVNSVEETIVSFIFYFFPIASNALLNLIKGRHL